MDMIHYIGTVISLMISDPWDFGTQCGIGPFKCNVRDVNETSILAVLFEPITFNGKRLVTVVCRLRHAGLKFDELLVGKELPSNFMLLEEELASLSELSKAKSSVPAIGTIIRS